jgi:Concanavalin A-like lectin/glucanases superfamily
MWVNPSGTFDTYAGLLFNRNSGVTGGFGYTGGQLGYTWDNGSANTYNFRSGLVPPLGLWSFVALVISPTNAILYMINTNGVLSATNVLAHTADVFGNNWQIGRDDINNNLTDGARVFTGSIDEVAVFTYSLTPAQLQSLYASGAVIAPVTLSIQQSGANVTLAWPFGLLLQADSITGPWTTNTAASSPYTVPASAAQRFYRVQVK